jgi:hypothetical protein
MGKLEMVLLEQIDYLQLQLTLMEFYLEKKFYNYQVVVIILVQLQMILIHIVGDIISIYLLLNNFFL